MWDLGITGGRSRPWKAVQAETGSLWETGVDTVGARQAVGKLR